MDEAGTDSESIPVRPMATSRPPHIWAPSVLRIVVSDLDEHREGEGPLWEA